MLTSPLSITKKDPIEKEYKPLPEELFQVEFFDVSESRNVTWDTKQLPPDQQEFETVLSAQFVVLEGEHRGRSVWVNYIPTNFFISKKYGKNKLYQIVEGLLGREITINDYAEMEKDAVTYINNLIGKQCRVLLKTSISKKGNPFSDVQAYRVAKELLPKLTDEEKEKARVKNKDTNSDAAPSSTASDAKEIRVEDIPF